MSDCWFCLLLLLGGTAAHAEMDSADYLPGGAALAPAERPEVQARVEAERQAARAREVAELDEREASRMRELAIEASRPFPERLHEQRCASCHPAGTLDDAHHTWLGWYLTIARMRWLNGAVLRHDEALVVAGYLTQRKPLRGIRALLEWALIGVVPLSVLAVWLGWRRWRRTRARKRPPQAGL